MPYRFLSKLVMILICLPVFAGAEPLQPVSLQLIWKHQFQFAGYYMAQQKGFYKDAGIDLTIHEYENGR